MTFLTRRNVQRRAVSAVVGSMNLFPTENYFTAATKPVISPMQSFTKKISGRKGKDSAEMNIGVEI